MSVNIEMDIVAGGGGDRFVRIACFDDLKSRGLDRLAGAHTDQHFVLDNKHDRSLARVRCIGVDLLDWLTVSGAQGNLGCLHTCKTPTRASSNVPGAGRKPVERVPCLISFALLCGIAAIPDA